jgi:hypothetical protein
VPLWNFPPGFALATVFAGGIPSTSGIVSIAIPVPSPPTLISPAKSANGPFQFAFTNVVGACFGVLAAEDLALPATNWTPLGGVAETSPGYFQFADPQASNTARRFYRVRTR